MSPEERSALQIRRNRRRSRRSAAALLLAAVAVCLIVAVVITRMRLKPPVVSAPTPFATSSPAQATPPWTLADKARLQREIRDAFAPALAAAQDWSLAVVSADGHTIFEDRAANALAPASAQKLIVADTALRLLGPQFRFHTMLKSSESIGGDGTLPGDLWLVGSGDPSLTRDDLRNGVAQAWKLGVRRVRGSAIVDATALPGPELNPFWNGEDRNEDYEAPTSAVSLDQDTLEFHIIGNASGQSARVTFLPPNDVIRLTGGVSTAPADTQPNVRIVATAPNAYQVSGSIPALDEEKVWIPLRDVPQYVGGALTRMLRDRGIAVDGRARAGRAPLGALPVWDHRSPPLRDIVRRMFYESNNHFAEQLLRSIAAVRGSRYGDAPAFATERAQLASRGVPVPGFQLVDGSGLAHANRVAAITLAELLAESDLYRLLPLGGREGTLKDYPFGAALGRVRAKSGHIFGADSLAGYVTTMRHGRVAFAFILAGPQSGATDDAIVRAVDRLATF